MYALGVNAILYQYHIDVIPTVLMYDSVHAALGWFKSCMVEGDSIILPELFVWWLHHSNQLVRLLELVWKDGHIARDWRYALIVPVFKKGT